MRTENFVARLGKANLATKSDLYDLLKETDFDNKLNNISKIVIWNKKNYVETEKKLIDLTKKVAQISEKIYDFFLGRMYSTGIDGYQNFLVCAPILSSLTLDNNEKVTNWIYPNIINWPCLI